MSLGYPFWHYTGGGLAGVGGAVSGTATQSLSIGQSAADQVIVSGTATQSLALAQTAAGQVYVSGLAAQSLALAQSASGSAVVTALADQSLSVNSTATGEPLVSLSAAPQSLSLASGPTVQVIPIPGGSFVAGTFSKGQWRNLKEDLAARRKREQDEREAAERAAHEKRQRQIEAIAAEIAARRQQEDAANAAVIEQLRAQAARPLSGLQGLDLGAAQVAHGQKLAALAKAKRDAEEEEEALALLMN